jgi:colanic acid/amylovoran biosynthesis glycosyltransferase
VAAEHVHAHFGTNSTTVAMLVAALGGPGYSFHVHGPEEFDKPAAIALGEKIRAAASCAPSATSGAASCYRQIAYEHWPKVQIVRCGVEAAFLEGDGRPFPTAPRLVSVGRLSEQKGQILLIEALGQLAREGVAFELTLVGDGEMRPRSKRPSRSTGSPGACTSRAGPAATRCASSCCRRAP